MRTLPRARRLDVGEALLTATLLSVYIGCRGTARALGGVQAIISR